jgi:putative acyl-CoA dehydrogenase
MVVTHEVLNQPPPLEGYDVYGADAALREAVQRHRAAAAEPRLSALGRLAGTAEWQRVGHDANANPPVLRTHDRYGHRVDEVDFHPSWHQLMVTAVGHGLHAAPWTSAEDAPHVVRAAGFMVWSQVEAGHGCPISMTYAAVPALAVDPVLSEEWVPRLASTTYEFGLRDPAGKAGCIAGMAMTEKQGGSDVRANTTVAEPTADDGVYRLTGHKWFCSAPMSDVFLLLAQAPGGLTCVVVPRVLPDGSRNVFRIQRLKEKLGNRSNASSEIELSQTLGHRLGDEGRGVRTIVEMVAATRLDCVLGSAALMRQAVAQATHHAAHRSAFGRTLVDQPLMVAVLADLALESEAATATGLRLAAAVDGREEAFRRIAVPVAKYWVTKRAPMLTAEALECLGGNGYAEESGMPRLYREAPVNSVWEGSGNVMALDVLRAAAREPDAVPAFLTELDAAAGADARYDAWTKDLREELGHLGGDDDAQAGARGLVERMALALQASLLLRHAPAAVADGFCAARLRDRGGLAFGTLPRGVDARTVVDRATPTPG